MVSGHAGCGQPQDLAQHEGIVRLHLKPTIGAKRLAKLTPREVHGLYRTKLADGLSPGRVRRIHVTLSRALKDAVRWRDLLAATWQRR